MLIYEKDNKLNINFENNVDESPDLQIGNEDGKTEVLIDGQSISGSDSGTLVVNILTFDTITGTGVCTVDKTMQEVVEAVNSRQNVICVFDRPKIDNGDTISYIPLISVKINGSDCQIMFSKFDGVYIESVTASQQADMQYWTYEEYMLNS